MSRLLFPIRRGVMAVLLIAVFIFSAPPARADAWGTNLAAVFVKSAIEKIQRQIEGVLLASLKGAAIQMLDSQVNQLLGGGNGGAPVFITNYEDYIHGVASDKTQEVMNDFFTTSMRGKYAAANYIEVGGVDGASFGEGNVPGMIEREMRLATQPNPSYPQYNFDQLSTNPNMTGGLGSFRDLDLYVSNPMNNPIGASIVAQEIKDRTLSENIEIQKVKALSSGFIPKEVNGQVITPAGTFEAMVASAKTLPNLVIANAENPEELVGGLISSFANRAISNLIQVGIGNTQSKILGNFGGVGNQVANALGNQLTTNGPGAQFARDIAQEATIKVRSYTNPANYGSYDP